MACGPNESAHTNGVDWTKHGVAHLEAGLYGLNPTDCSSNELNPHGLWANPWTSIWLGQLALAFSCLLVAGQPCLCLRLHLYLDWMTKSICEFVT